ncbi:MAG: hypothetical protein JWN08_2910 [Frankiales bacterium]|nr:hypothetical protein [Frankiales bacterium]
MTEGLGYSERLQRLELARWKRVLDVQAPYRWNVRRLCRGRVLDVGCGIGRNLEHLAGRAVGVDHNPTSVAVARSRGLDALTVGEFFAESGPAFGSFDTLLAAHLLEHLDRSAADEVLRSYLPYLRPGSHVVLITPQERGWASDATHVRWVGPRELGQAADSLGLEDVRQRSFPFPAPAGKVFRYNEFVMVGRTPS